MYIQLAPKEFYGFHRMDDTQALRQFWEKACQPVSRPCPGCTIKSETSYCSQPCQQAARLLSSEPERYPIEPKVLPLVFAFTKLAFVQPCWSCEGHNKPSGELWKLPQLWFYSYYPIYVDLLNTFIEEMRQAELMFAQWNSSVIAYGEKDCHTYVLQPLVTDTGLTLTELQHDIEVMGRCCEAGMTGLAYKQVAT